MMLLTRAIVVLSTVAAALALAYLATPYLPPPSFWVATAGLVVMAIAGRRLRPIALPAVLSLPYLIPAILLRTVGNENFTLDFVWILPLVGLALSGPGAWTWSLPAAWRWPLITWGLVVAVSWPIVFMREADFTWWTLWANVSNSSKGISPGEVNQHVAYLAVIHGVGILWLDALCRWYRTDRAAFTREVLYPLAITAAIGSLVAIYQGFVDLSFLNRGFWTYMLRAAGTHGDPNKLGAVVGLWTVATVVLARRWPSRWRGVAALAAIVVGVGAVWTSGSRTGLAAVGVSLAIAAVETARARWSARLERPLDVRRLAIAGAAAVLLAAGVVVALQNASTHTIVQRGTLGYLPFFGDRGIANSANELLWERFGYGPAAIAMVKEHPVEGVGVGMFHTLVHDYGTLRGYDLTPDNAQSWFRHMVAELGMVGALPALWWCVLLAALLFAPGTPADRLSFGMLRGVLVGFGVASMFGMPGQSLAVAMTFWALVFWVLVERGGEVPAIGGPGRRSVAMAIVLVAVHASLTVVSAFGDLRPRERAQRFDWFYRYGLLELEPDPGGHPIQRRWTLEDAVAVIPVKGKILKFVAWIDHPDGDDHPPQVRIRADGRVVFEGPLRRSAPLFLDIPATPGETHLLLETSINRLYRPAEQGSRDRRALGLSIRDWVWE